MLILTQNAYESFSEELNYCKNSDQTWRCAAFKFSYVKDKPHNWFTIAAEKLNALIGNEGTIYLFPDQDIFVLSRHANRKSLDAVYDQLGHIFGLVPASMACQLYELPVHMEFVLAELEKKRPAPEKTPVAPQALRDSNPFVDPDFKSIVKTLKDRRLGRNKAEILVSDDDPFSSRLVCKTIDANYSSLSAFNGRETLHSYLLNAPDILFLDLGLPDMNGLDILANIMDADPDAYIVILSGKGSKENVMKAMKVGAKGFIAKPFTREKIFQYIERCPSIRQKVNRSQI